MARINQLNPYNQMPVNGYDGSGINPQGGGLQGRMAGKINPYTVIGGMKADPSTYVNGAATLNPGVGLPVNPANNPSMPYTQPNAGGYDGSGINPNGMYTNGSIPHPNGSLPNVPQGGIPTSPVANPAPGANPQIQQMLQGLNLPSLNGQQYVATTTGAGPQSPAIPGANWQNAALTPTGGAWQNMPPVPTGAYTPFPVTGGAGATPTMAPVGTGTSAQVGAVSGGAGGQVEDPALAGKRIQGFLDDLLNSDNPYITNAARRGLENAGQRGMLNSSISAGASTRSAIEAAQPILNEIAGLNSSREGMRFQGGESAAARNLQAALQAQDLNFTGGQNDQNRSLQAAMQAAGFNFEGGQNDANRNLQATMQNTDLNFKGSQNAADRTLQSAMQAAGFNFEGTQQDFTRNLQQSLAQQGWSYDAAQQEAQRQVQVLLNREGRAFQGEQAGLDRTQGVNNAILGNELGLRNMQAGNYYDQSNAILGNKLGQNAAQQDYEFKKNLQSDSVAQQDWLSNNQFSREFNSALSMVPIKNAAQLQDYMVQAAINQPEVFTPEVMSGMQNFFNNNFLALMQSYFPQGTP